MSLAQSPQSGERHGALPELILLPGSLCDDDLWRDQVTGLADAAYCRVADLTRGETIEELARTVLREARPTFALAGFSFGGYVAQEIARQAPQRIERLALLDTSICADTPQRFAMRRSLADAARTPGAFQGMADRMLPTFIDPARLWDADLVGRIKAMTKRLGRDVLLRQNAMSRRDGEAVMRILTCPVLLVCGKNDALTPLSEHRELAAMIETARLCVIPGSGHMTPMEKPEAVTAALRAWLTR
jgi:pimeloyl-ACP methyl ester carboxylesterase